MDTAGVRALDQAPGEDCLDQVDANGSKTCLGFWKMRIRLVFRRPSFFSCVMVVANLLMLAWALGPLMALFHPCGQGPAGAEDCVRAPYVAGLELSLVVILWMGMNILVVLTRADSLRRANR